MPAFFAEKVNKSIKVRQYEVVFPKPDCKGSPPTLPISAYNTTCQLFTISNQVLSETCRLVVLPTNYSLLLDSTDNHLEI